VCGKKSTQYEGSMGKQTHITLKRALTEGRLEDFARQQDRGLRAEPGHKSRFTRLLERAAAASKARRKAGRT
jgi:hypothetical protein